MLSDNQSSNPENGQSESSAVPERQSRLTAVAIAGILTLVAGILSVYNGLVGVNAGVFLGYDVFREGLKYSFCGAFLVAFGIIAIVGGYLAIKGKHVIIAVIGACLAMAGGGLAGFWLGLIAMILIFLSDADLTS